MTSSGWEFSDDAPMFVSRDQMQVATAAFERETKEAQANGEHYIVVVVGYKVDLDVLLDPGRPVALSADSLRVTPSVGCFICEEPFQRGMNPHCPGAPT